VCEIGVSWKLRPVHYAIFHRPKSAVIQLGGYLLSVKAKEMLTNKKRLKNIWKTKRDVVGL
jgi:hypothetical protein